MAETIERISKRVNVKCPRAYKISDRKTLNVFIRDFRLTTVLGSLKIIIKSKSSHRMIFDKDGTVSYNINKYVLKEYLTKV